MCDHIISQQLSGKVASVIFNRFLSLFPHDSLSPEKILSAPDIDLRNTGMAWAKVKSIKDLASKITTGEVTLSQLPDMSHDEVIAELTKVKGIGKWTAEMFLMFTLGREDIFSHGDLGLRNGIKKLYNLSNPTFEDIENICSRWKPYRTHACRILWKSLSPS